MLLEWRHIQSFCVIRAVSEGMENYVKGLPANAFWSQDFSCRVENSQRMCDVHHDFLSQKTGDSYRLLNSLSLDDPLAARNSFFAFYYSVGGEYPYKSLTYQVPVQY